MIGRSRRSRSKAAAPRDGRRSADPSRRPGPRRPPGRRLPSPWGPGTLAAQVFLLQVIVVLVLVAAAAAALVLQGRYDGDNDARKRSLAAAEAFAHAPGTALAFAAPDPTKLLQTPVMQAQAGAGIDFISVLNTKGVRLADTEPRLIGTKAQDVGRAVAGETFTDTFHGKPADAVRAVVPVMDASRRVVGVVTAGIQVENVGYLLDQQVPMVLGSAALALALATAGTALVTRRLRRQTHGLGPAEMTRMYEHHDAVLHAVREGVLIVGADGRLLLANDEARRLLLLPPDADQRHVTELGLAPDLTRILVAGEVVSDEVCPAGDRLLAVNTRRTAPYGDAPGLVASFRDTTELRALSGRAETARGRLTLLYEAGVRIGTTLDVQRTAEELAEVAVDRLADVVTVELLEAVLHGEEPTGAVHRMRRTALRGSRHPLQPVGDLIQFVVADTPMVAALRQGRAVLVPDLRAAEDWRAQDPEGAGRVLDSGIHSLIAVPLRARGVVLGMVNFWRGAGSPRFDEEDVAVAEELGARAAVAIDNARRYSREHAMAVTLQRSLLPRDLPEQDALEVAWRYRPAQSGVGGDWFDVIPLPGFRTALVVGDVVGHGLHAAVTMGRLRTAVLNFSSLDLPPDELLGHLDEMVSRLDTPADGPDDGEGSLVTGATCLYVIYDPVGGHCTFSRAGHVAPAVVDPVGRVTFPDLPLSPPLGVGGHPFESGELTLPEGSRLVLFTDGLIEDRRRDIDEGLSLLAAAVAHPDQSPEETCRALMETMLPEHPSDDVALLVARTRLLDPSHVAVWDVPFDVSAVSRVRTQVSGRLADWELEDSAFATELILSELLTNAIRYGAPPVRVRMLLGRTLVCEVSDGSNTSPRLRRAATTDEGGRGLFLVSQFADRWGTRYVADGKVIWAEQSLGRAPEPDPAALIDQLAW
ncbi:SpoIIE family protein phosphatase [Streptomyces sp. NPDC004042]|uniref:SpoIIE family protein phosphatase n=1 Tax=Streptomyces sp. NPDC004042 TaxID=3154451 RepID=UPI0033B60CB4